MKNRRLISIGAGAAALTGVLVGGVLTLQGAGASSPSALTAFQDSGADDSTATSDRQAVEAAYLARLAANLGIDEATLTAALKQTSLDILDQKVADGTITQAEADSIRAEIEAGGHLFFGAGPGGHHGRGGHGGHGFGVPGADSAALATFLGIDATTLRDSLRAGESLATVAADAGKSRDELKAFLTAAITAHLDEEVASGEHTQDEADAKLARFAANLDAMIDGQFTGRHGHGASPEATPDSSTNSSPSTSTGTTTA